jgi:ubiquinone/menaquinone biosynthesis C-methylase UbiE
MYNSETVSQKDINAKKPKSGYEAVPIDYVEGRKTYFERNPDAEKPIKLMLDEIMPIIKDADIADIGCGDAPNLDFYLSSEAKHIYLIDPAKEILDIVHERVESGYKLEKVSFSIGDFENNDLKDESLDVVVSRFSSHYNTNIESAFKSVYRKLSNGGSFFIVVPHPDDSQNQTIFKKEGKDYIRINLYGTFFAEYPVHKMEEYLSDFVKNNFDIIENKTFTYDELGLDHLNSNNAVLYIHLRKKV